MMSPTWAARVWRIGTGADRPHHPEPSSRRIGARRLARSIGGTTGFPERRSATRDRRVDQRGCFPPTGRRECRVRRLGNTTYLPLTAVVRGSGESRDEFLHSGPKGGTRREVFLAHGRKPAPALDRCALGRRRRRQLGVDQDHALGPADVRSADHLRSVASDAVPSSASASLMRSGTCVKVGAAAREAARTERPRSAASRSKVRADHTSSRRRSGTRRRWTRPLHRGCVPRRNPHGAPRPGPRAPPAQCPRSKRRVVGGSANSSPLLGRRPGGERLRGPRRYTSRTLPRSAADGVDRGGYSPDRRGRSAGGCAAPATDRPVERDEGFRQASRPEALPWHHFRHPRRAGVPA